MKVVAYLFGMYNYAHWVHRYHLFDEVPFFYFGASIFRLHFLIGYHPQKHVCLLGGLYTVNPPYCCGMHALLWDARGTLPLATAMVIRRGAHEIRV
jgi:hypothetical protein